MPSIVEKMQPWTQTHSFIPPLLLRRSWSSSSSNAASTPLASSSSVTSLLSSASSSGGGGGGGVGGSSSDPKNSSGKSGASSSSITSSKNSSARGPSSSSTTTTNSIFSKFCSSASGSKSGSSSSSSNKSSASNNVPSSGPSRPKRKTPILSTCMSNWVKFDHDCQKPLPCGQCESNPEHKSSSSSNNSANSRVLFRSGDNVLISTGKSGSNGKHHFHRHSHSFFCGGGVGSGSGSSGNHSHNYHNPQHAKGIMSQSEPASPTDCSSIVVRANGSIVSDNLLNSSNSGNSNASANGGSSNINGNAFPGEVVSYENGKNMSSLKIVINVPCLDMFQNNENIRMEFVCNKNKLSTGKDLQKVQRIRQELQSSGWYWGGIDSEAAMEILESAQPGAFIVRDSSDPRFLYSLSIQTERGPTSVRLPYRNGKFSLDGDERIADKVPHFDSVIALIEHYVNGGTKIGKKVSVWIDHEGSMHSTVKLTKPVRREVGSLKHLARVAINKHNLLTKNNNNGATTSADSSSSSCISAGSVPIPCSSVNSTMVSSASSSTTVKSESAIGSSSSSSTPNAIAPVADLISKLPKSLRDYMLEYPHKL